MARLNIDTDVSERARAFVADQFSARGRFTLLEKLSGISSAQWQNFYYAKQGLNEKMLAFLVKRFPHDEIWLITGKKAPEQSKFPFLAPVPKGENCETIGQRLNWVIREWASPKGDTLFRYLQEKAASNNKNISADEWAQVVLGLAEPTLEMVQTVCWASRRYFTEWIILGSVGSPQVDPTNETSVAEWVARDAASFKALENSFLVSKKHGNKKS